MTIADPDLTAHLGGTAAVADAKSTWLRAQQAADDRTQRIVRKATELLRGEYALGMGGFSADGLLVDTIFSEASPWDGDIVAVQAWCRPSTASITCTLTVARALSPTVYTSILAVPIVLAPTFAIADLVTVNETDLTGGPNVPNLTTLSLVQAGVTTDLAQRDVVYCTLTAVSGTPLLFGLQLKCTMRATQAPPIP